MGVYLFVARCPRLRDKEISWKAPEADQKTEEGIGSNHRQRAGRIRFSKQLLAQSYDPASHLREIRNILFRPLHQPASKAYGFLLSKSTICL